MTRAEGAAGKVVAMGTARGSDRALRWAVAALLVAVADAVLLYPGGPHGWVTAARVTGIAVVAAMASRLPVPAFLAALALAPPGGPSALLVWTAYQTGRLVVSRSGIAVAAVGVVCGLAWQLLLLSAPAGPVVSGYVVFVALPMVLGRYLAQHRSLRSARDAHRRQQRREHALLADQERLRERLRIARDVHDSLGHRLSLISIQAAALEVTHLPPRQREAVRELAATARHSLDELHTLVGALRGRAEPGTRSLGALDGLAAEFRAAGTPVTVLREGTAGVPAPAAEHAAYRVVEEGLTNAARHAPGQPVTVALRGEGDTLLVSVRNPLPAHPAASSGRTGHGLAGLDERVRLAGGVFHTRTSDAEFRLVAMLPLAEAVEEAGPPAAAPGRDRLWVVALALTAAVLVLVTGPTGVPGG